MKLSIAVYLLVKLTILFYSHDIEDHDIITIQVKLIDMYPRCLLLTDRIMVA